MIRTLSFVNTGTYVWAILPYSAKIKRVRGNYSGATASLWLQFFTGTQNSPNDTDISKPANGTVPLESFAIYNPEFLEERAIAGLIDVPGPMVAVLSTTQSTLTAATTETLLDLWVDIEAYEHPPDPAWTTTVQAAPSGLNQIWAEASSAPAAAQVQLWEMVLSNGTSAVAYLKFFAVDAPANGLVPFMQITIPANTAYPFQRLVFGEALGRGLAPFQQTSDGVNHAGCSVALEAVGGGYNGAGLTAWKYQVKFK